MHSAQCSVLRSGCPGDGTVGDGSRGDSWLVPGTTVELVPCKPSFCLNDVGLPTPRLTAESWVYGVKASPSALNVAEYRLFCVAKPSAISLLRIHQSHIGTRWASGRFDQTSRNSDGPFFRLIADSSYRPRVVPDPLITQSRSSPQQPTSRHMDPAVESLWFASCSYCARLLLR